MFQRAPGLENSTYDDTNMIFNCVTFYKQLTLNHARSLETVMILGNSIYTLRTQGLKGQKRFNEEAGGDHTQIIPS